MPKQNVKLTDKQIQAAKPQDKPYKLYDTENLYLLVRPTGTKVWQYPYKLHEKHNVYTIGQYPDVKPAQAREERDKAKKLIKAGVAPIMQKPGHQVDAFSPDSFHAVGLQYLNKQDWVKKHLANVTAQMERDVFAFVGKRPVAAMNRRELLAVIKKIEERGALDVAKRTAQHCVKIFDYAIDIGLCDNNPALRLSNTVKVRRKVHRKMLPPEELPVFLERLENYPGSKLVKLAMQLLMLTFVRPGELRKARWQEFDFDKKIWLLPQERMKMKRDHLVPLSQQALQVLSELKEISGNNELLFPGQDPQKPISDVTLIKCIKILGYHGRANPHGMRALASTILHEEGLSKDVIEFQLAHVAKDKTWATYNRAEYLPQRTMLMEYWSNHLMSYGLFTEEQRYAAA